jgi:hypothetical protein
MKKIQRTAICLAVAAVLLGGCGGGAGSTEATLTTSNLTRAQYIKQANNVCKEGLHHFEKALDVLAKNPAESKAEKEEFIVETGLPPYRQMVDRLRALGAPAQDKAKVQAILASYYRELKAIEDDPAKAFSGDPSFARAKKLAVSYGLDACNF